MKCINSIFLESETENLSFPVLYMAAYDAIAYEKLSMTQRIPPSLVSCALMTKDWKL